jgi:imidazolonepropionase-like amidohydrolase
MASHRAARAIGIDDVVGTITPGKASDIVAFKVSGADPLAAILEDPALRPMRIWVGTQRVDC